VLDAGCGTGGNGEFLWRYGQPFGADLAREALVLGWRRLPGRIAGASVEALPFLASSFDLVTSFDVLYHRAVIDEQTALRETWRVLKPGGYFLLRLPAYRWLSSAHDRRVHGRHRYTAGEVRATLATAGFQVERLSYINSLLFPVPLLQRLLERVRPAQQDDSEMLPPSPSVNTALRLVLQAEAAWLGRGGRFPVGLSVLSLARKPALPDLQ
jgi:SAM-dependent methyltransferase